MDLLPCHRSSHLLVEQANRDSGGGHLPFLRTRTGRQNWSLAPFTAAGLNLRPILARALVSQTLTEQAKEQWTSLLFDNLVCKLVSFGLQNLNFFPIHQISALIPIFISPCLIYKIFTWHCMTCFFERSTRDFGAYTPTCFTVVRRKWSSRSWTSSL